jgi:hypothetical protein
MRPVVPEATLGTGRHDDPMVTSAPVAVLVLTVIFVWPSHMGLTKLAPRSFRCISRSDDRYLVG